MSKVKRYIKISAVTIVFLAVAAYIVYAVLVMSAPDPEERCADVELVIDRNSGPVFITDKDVNDILQNRHIFPKGRRMIDVDAAAIEKAIAENPFVHSTECYKTAAGHVCIKVVQRQPVIFVMPEGAEGYYVDAHGKVIPNSLYLSNIITATGKISRKYATSELAGFGEFLRNNKFWDDLIAQVYVSKDRKGKEIVELVPRVGDNIIFLGSLDGYHKKLRRLKVFYDKAVGTVGWNKYRTISLQYDNQIICTKREHNKQ